LNVSTNVYTTISLDEGQRSVLLPGRSTLKGESTTRIEVEAVSELLCFL